MDESNINTYKILMVGDSLTGKSSILHRYTDYMFSRSPKTIIGPEFKIKRIRVEDDELNLQIWDTSSEFIPSFYYRDVCAFILVFDISNKSSIDNIKDKWLKEIQKYYNIDINNNTNNNSDNNNCDNNNNSNNSDDNNSNSNRDDNKNQQPITESIKPSNKITPIIIILANKIDLLNDSSNKDILAFEEKDLEGFPLYKVSAKDNMGIEVAFYELAKIIHHKNNHNSGITHNNNNYLQHCTIL